MKFRDTMPEIRKSAGKRRSNCATQRNNAEGVVKIDVFIHGIGHHGSDDR